jgi:hypothetical protein
MGLEFLARVRRTSLWLGGIVALMTFTYLGAQSGLSVAGGVVWSLVNLALLQTMIVALTGRERESLGVTLRVWGSAAGMIAWFGAGAFLLSRLSLMGLLAGFLLPFAVIVFKAAALIVVGSRAWSRLAAHPRRNGAIIATLAIAAWAALSVWPIQGATLAGATAQVEATAPALEQHIRLSVSFPT